MEQPGHPDQEGSRVADLRDGEKGGAIGGGGGKGEIWLTVGRPTVMKCSTAPLQSSLFQHAMPMAIVW